LPKNSLDLNILSEDGGRASLAEIRSDFKRRRPKPRRKIALALLGFMGLPMIYATGMPLISGDLNAAWFQEWANSTAGLSRVLSAAFPGLAAGSSSIYGEYAVPLADFLNFASVDILCVIGICLIVFSRSPRLVPRDGGAQLNFLSEIARGFPLGRGKTSRRVGGPAGGLWYALLFALLTLGPLYFFYARPLMNNGQIFIDAHSHCAVSSGWGRHSHCIQYAENSLDQTIWKLGWMASLAAILVPVGLWIGLVGLLYPIWLAMDRPARR
jgi:hypothetical protein